MNDELNLVWSEPRIIRGRSLRVAQPTPEFWALWRSDKAAIKESGISCAPARDGGWEVLEWSDALAENIQEVPKSDPAFVPVVSRPARHVADFVAPELNLSVQLSPEQVAIIDWFRHGKGNIVVQARAGTGKTFTIELALSQAPEEEQLYAVFNKKNQLEAERKISDARVTVKTLHGCGYKLIRSVWHNARPDSTDGIENDRVMSVVTRNAADDVHTAVKRLVGFAKNCFVNPSMQDLLDLSDARDINGSDSAPEWNIERICSAALKVLEASKIRDSQGRISFNDMVWLPVAMGWVRPSYDLVVIDEAQDMNLPQLLMARGLVRPGGRMCVVGDDRQAIYGFRGAAQDGMGMMIRDLKAEVLPLTITRRCPKAVVALAVELVPGYRAADEAPEGLVREMGDGLLVDAAQVGDAILSRANAPLMPLCLRLLRRGVSARIEGRDIGKTLIALVKKMNARTIPQFISKVNTWGDKQKARCANSKNYEAKCELINDQVETLIAVVDGLSGVSEIEPRITSLFQDTDGFSKPAVVLSSVHKAKGLEWDRVFILSKTFKPGATGEEANIFYVAITRAKQELVRVYEEKPKDN